MCSSFFLSLNFPVTRVTVGVIGFSGFRGFSSKSSMRILNVAEKNNAAENLAAFLSKGTARKREGLSRMNKIFEFEYQIFGQNSTMIMTSVSGHLLNYAFVSPYNNWKSTDPKLLFDVPLQKYCLNGAESIKKTLEREIRTCSKLIIWTDCDREGENIGFEIISVCKAVKANIEVYRAKFSEITQHSVTRAINNLQVPNENISNAVDVRQILDLKIGAAFTRFQTLLLMSAFPNVFSHNVVSYGSCQFPTLGFVVERFKAASEFIPEKFWQVNVQHTLNGLSVNFQWKRTRLFDKLACEVLHDRCVENGMAVVENVESKFKQKWRPKPLHTVELEKLASRKLKINAKQTMKVAEKLYSMGLISYPRTETNIFPKELDFVPLVQAQTESVQWGEFAQKVLKDGPNPFQGNNSDQAHPPIHPLKFANELMGDEKKIYELIVRSFLACLSKHAEGLETTVEIDIAEEKVNFFNAKGLMITVRNYLDVYPYDSWNDQEIHVYRKGETFKAEISMTEGETTPPQLLTEADLIALMEKHEIGTDATHAEHIETIKARFYVGLQDNKFFVPRTLGMGLVEGYNNMGYEMAKPSLRAELEADLKGICENQKSPSEVLAKYLEKYKKIYEGIQQQISRLIEAVQTYTQIEAVSIPAELVPKNKIKAVGKCSDCNADLIVRTSKRGKKYISCFGYPVCKSYFWFPPFVLHVSVTNTLCNKCRPDIYLLKFKFKKNECPLPPDYVGCIGGCDSNLLRILNVTKHFFSSPSGDSVQTLNPTRADETNDSGFFSLNNGSFEENLQPPNCHCDAPAVCLVVKKTGPNFGRKFYSCNAREKLSKCDFFQWKEEERLSVVKSRKSPADDIEEMRCYCAIPCKSKKVTKEGPNKGRVFFTCGKSMKKEKCNFFKWSDNDKKNVQLIENKIEKVLKKKSL